MKPSAAPLRLLLLLVTTFIPSIFCQGAKVGLTPEGPNYIRDTGKALLVSCKIIEPSPLSEIDDVEIKWVRLEGADGGQETPITNTGRLRTQSGTDKSELLLMITDLEKEDAGQYRCITRLNPHVVNTDITLTMTERVELTDCPAIQNPTSGLDATLKCAVEGKPPPEIIWYRGNDKIQNDDRFTLSEDNTEVSIREFDPETDDGEYRVEVMRLAYGDFLEEKITVSGFVKPTIVDWSDTIEGIEDQTLDLKCSATGKPAPTFTWARQTGSERKMIEGSQKYKMTENGHVLSIVALTPDDAGDYVCLAKNPVDQVERVTNVNVFLKPKIEAIANQTAHKGDTVELRCKFSGDGDITAYWMFNGHTLKKPDPEDPQQTVEGAYTTMEDENTLLLTLEDVQLNDAAEYQCNAANTAGNDIKRVFVEIIHSPMLVSKSEGPIRSFGGHRVSLFCQVEAVPVPQWTWSNDEADIVHDGSKFNIVTSEDSLTSTLEVVTNDEGDFGNYLCVADNGVDGALEETIQVIQVALPPSPNPLVINENHPNFAEVSIGNYFGLEESERPLNITFFYAQKGDYLEAEEQEVGSWDWYTDASKSTLNYDESNLYKLSGLDTETTYVVTAEAANEAGVSELSPQMVEYQTSEPRVPAAPLFVSDSETACEFKCEIAWAEPNNHGSGIQSYKLRYFKVSMDGQNNLAQLEGDQWVDDIPAHSHSVVLYDLHPKSAYEFQIVAVNAVGESPHGEIVLKTGEMGLEQGGMGMGMVVVLVIAIILVLIILVDLGCYYIGHCGLIMTMCVRCCGKTPPQVIAKEIALEEGKRTDEKAVLKESIAAQENTPMLSEESGKTNGHHNQNGNGNGKVNTEV